MAALTLGCTGNSVPPDEALERVRKQGGGYGTTGEFASLGPNSSAEAWKAAAERYYPPAALDYFEDMDRVTAGVKLKLSVEGVKGRTRWPVCMSPLTPL